MPRDVSFAGGRENGKMGAFHGVQKRGLPGRISTLHLAMMFGSCFGERAELPVMGAAVFRKTRRRRE